MPKICQQTYKRQVQCLRLAFDRLVKVPERRNWMIDIGRSNTSKLLDLAGADTSTFYQAYDDMMAYVGDMGNLQSIQEELKGSPFAGIWCICLLVLSFLLW